MNIQRKIVVRGKVQGVGFRNATWRKAMELGIRGSVRNLDDGSVEILASATDKADFGNESNDTEPRPIA